MLQTRHPTLTPAALPHHHPIQAETLMCSYFCCCPGPTNPMQEQLVRDVGRVLWHRVSARLRVLHRAHKLPRAHDPAAAQVNKPLSTHPPTHPCPSLRGAMLPLVCSVPQFHLGNPKTFQCAPLRCLQNKCTPSRPPRMLQTDRYHKRASHPQQKLRASNKAGPPTKLASPPSCHVASTTHTSYCMKG